MSLFGELKMDDHDITPADEKALALTYAFTALVKTLSDSGVIEMDHLFSNLAGAHGALVRVDETGAAELLGSLNESLQRI